jgi:phosphohistidine phosphatase SixA
MLLTLMRHGAAEPHASSDAFRPLSPEGQEAVRSVAAHLKAAGWVPGAVVCSPLLRSQQTASILREHFPGLPMEVLREVISTDESLVHELGARELVDPIVVGHEPGLSRLAARLIGASGLLAFETSSVACFRVDGFPPRRPAHLLFFVPPGLARCLAT